MTRLEEFAQIKTPRSYLKEETAIEALVCIAKSLPHVNLAKSPEVVREFLGVAQKADIFQWESFITFNFNYIKFKPQVLPTRFLEGCMRDP